jgi:hypothetical protein
MKRTITNDTMVRVARSFKRDEYLNPKFYAITTIGNLRELGICSFTEARDRVRAELATSVLSLVYDNHGTCYGINVEVAEVFATVAIEKHAEPQIRIFASEAVALDVLSNEYTMEEEHVPAKTLAELNEFLGGQIEIVAKRMNVEEA